MNRAELSRKNELYLPKERYYELKHFCLQYPLWKKELNSTNFMTRNNPDFKFSITNEINDPTGNLAICRAKVARKIDLVEKTAISVDKVIGPYILKAVTEGCSFNLLRTKFDIPCCKDEYYKLYHIFFKKLSIGRD